MNDSRCKHLCATYKATRLTRIFSLSLKQASKQQREAGRKENIWRLYACVCVCVLVLLCLSICVCACSHTRRCTADDGVYTTLSKRKEKAATRYCSFTSPLLSPFIFTTTTTLRTHTTHTQL
jgi:hypothetical protein